MNPEITELYKWSVRPCRGGWEAQPLTGTTGARTFPFQVQAMDYATKQARENAGQRVLMALILAAGQAVK